MYSMTRINVLALKTTIKVYMNKQQTKQILHGLTIYSQHQIHWGFEKKYYV